MSAADELDAASGTLIETLKRARDSVVARRDAIIAEFDAKIETINAELERHAAPPIGGGS